MKRPIFTEINGYNDAIIRTMMKSIQTYYKNNNETDKFQKMKSIMKSNNK